MDPETAPLLRDSEYDPDLDEDPHESTKPTFLDRLNAVAWGPSHFLSRILLITALCLLLLSAVFIGLFAHERSKLRQRERDGSKPAPTVTVASTSVLTTTVLPPSGPTSSPSEQPCLTPECIKLSASILSSLDETQDPCENFFDFTNGGYIASHPLPPDKSYFGQFEALDQANQRAIQHILETSSRSSPIDSYDRILLQKLRSFYLSCLNENRLNEMGDQPLLEFIRKLRRLFQGNEVLVPEKESTKTALTVKGLTAALAFLHSRGVEALFKFYTKGDIGADPKLMTLWFDQASLGLSSKEYYGESTVQEVYLGVIQKLLSIVFDCEEGQDKFNRTRKLAKQVFNFETRLAEASLDAEIYHNPLATYNRLTLANLSHSFPQVDFAEYLATFTPDGFPENVIVTYPAYATSLSEILNDTSAEVIEAYLVFRAALTLSPNLGMATEAWQAQRTLLEALTGTKKGAVGDRAEYCVRQVEIHLGFAVGRYFVNETFRGESRKRGTKIATDIVDAFKSALPNVTWLDKTSAKAAAAKADAIRIQVGYPLYPDTLDPASILKYYQDVDADENKYFQNILSALSSISSRTWSKLGKPRNVDEWRLLWPSTTNAYYDAGVNQIVFTAGIMQAPFFSHDWPNYLSYGGFGQVAAHELTHAFDNAGRLYDREGKLENWWTNHSNAAFQAKQNCIESQFSAYTVDDGKGGKVQVNGKLTVGENIADSGLIHAYRAWKAQYSRSLQAGNEYVLPGMNYTREQLFFISFGRIYTGIIEPATQIQWLRTDPHSPRIYRVDGTVSNIPEFAAAFKCSKNARLNPPREKQCRFWS
ncbi:Endothelin-converting enzyme 1 [Favolaschia claudopus]|uniref:Endothelin-converting enzyme 1 n=1 Tax=Favolaschia claudopus TaxID=2862362 RepID=A0AAW0BCQ6_9AGAR